MALPKLNGNPKYEMTIPSMQKAVRFRPYLVKEEKVLLMAFESQDTTQAMKAIIDTIEVCVDDKINTSSCFLLQNERPYNRPLIAQVQS